MYSRGKSIALLAIICFFANTIKAEERIAYKKHWDFPSGLELFFDPRSYEASDEYHNPTYVICDKPDDLQSERNCTAVQDTQPERSCPVTLKNFTADGDELAIYPFGSTRAVIFWSKRYSLSKRSTIKCIILDFGTCESIDVLLEKSFDRIRWTYFVAYEDSFDLVTISSTIKNGHNKYHVDVEGNVTFSSWKNYLNMEQFTSAAAYRAITADSKLKVYLHFGKSFFDVSSTITSLVKPDGWRKVLVVTKKYWNTAFIRVESTAHETIGIAYALENVIEVSQFDQEGELKLNTSLTYDVKEVKSLSLLNLADGGFLLSTIGSNDGNPDAYYLTKVDARGKVVGTIKKEPEPNCEYKPPSLRVFDNEAKEHCFVIVCHDHHTLDLVVKSFSDEDFSDGKMPN